MLKFVYFHQLCSTSTETMQLRIHVHATKFKLNYTDLALFKKSN